MKDSKPHKPFTVRDTHGVPLPNTRKGNRYTPNSARKTKWGGDGTDMTCKIGEEGGHARCQKM